MPQRNKNFTGRLSLLDRLGDRLVQQDVAAVLPHALQGLGGVGKTQLAVEYAYRNSGSYDVVWWIPADQPALIRSSLAALAPRLGLEDIPQGRVEDAVDAVLDALRRGEPYSRWLLIFDNADQPESIREFFPQGQPHGHVLVTSRNHRWQSHAETVEVDVFTRDESLEFLVQRVRGIAAPDAGRLAEELGDLPLALEQAGALQVEAGMSVDDYLELLGGAAQKLLAENPPSDYPVSVAAAWSLSMGQLKEQMPFALEVLRLCAFFGPEPIPRELLINGAAVLDEPLRDQLSDSILVSRAMRELGRYALARIDNSRRTIQVHRLIQRLIREDLRVEEAKRLQSDVHQLLITANPHDPDIVGNWPRYADLIAHLDTSGIVESGDPRARRFVANVALYLYNIGDYATCNALIDRAIEQWTADSGPDDLYVLVMTGQKAAVLFGLGDYEAAYSIRKPTFERMKSVLGDNNEYTLRVMNGHGADLRARGLFDEARQLDEDSLDRHRQVFGPDQLDTFFVVNNLSVDHELTGDYAVALELDEQNSDDLLNFYGRDDDMQVVFNLTAISRDLRHQGRYRESLARAEQASALYQGLVRSRVLPQDHPWILEQARDLSIVQRLAGDVEIALAGARSAYERYLGARLGTGHPATLAAGLNYGNALRLAGSLGMEGGSIDDGVAVLEEIVSRYGSAWIPDHPFVHVGTVNLGVGRLVQKKASTARRLLQEALTGLERTVGDDHHYALVCSTNLATAHADLGDTAEAARIGEKAAAQLVDLLGARHPHALACALNLALDRAALGLPEAEEDREASLAILKEVLGGHHYDVTTVRARGRVSSVIEPPPV